MPFVARRVAYEHADTFERSTRLAVEDLEGEDAEAGRCGLAAADTAVAVGYAIYSWEGSPWVSCTGELGWLDWTPETWRAVWGSERPREGARRYVRVEGRWNDDPSAQGIIGAPTFFVRRVIATSKTAPGDCRPAPDAPSRDR